MYRYVNFFGGSPLNRLSWLRTSHNFLNAIALAPSTRWVVLQGGQPLLVSEPSTHKRSLARLSTADVRPLLGSEPFFSQGQAEGEYAPSDVLVVEAARFRGPPVVFLGLHEPQTDVADALPSSDFSAKSDTATVIANLKGTPYFSLDVSDVAQDVLDKTLQASEPSKAGAELTFFESRGAMAFFDAFESCVFAEARSLTDWNGRNKVRRNVSVSDISIYLTGLGIVSSVRRADPPATRSGQVGRYPARPSFHGRTMMARSHVPPRWLLTSSEYRTVPESSLQCRKGLHNFAHPRTDAVVIMAVVDKSGEKVLLGRNVRRTDDTPRD